MRAETSLRIHSDLEGAVDDALGIFRQEVEAAERTRGRAGIALSGGKTPRALFERMGGAEFQGWRCWGSLHVFWVDERAVDPAHVESNYRLARETFLRRVPVPEDQIHRMRGEAPDLEAEAIRYARTLETWNKGGKPRLDFVLLGLGADAHTASLFPGSPALAERERWVVVAPGPRPGERRLTLTLPALDAARAIQFLVAGEEKAEAVARAVQCDEPVDSVPACGVRPQDGKLYWVLDRAAASRLGRPLGVPPSR